VVAVREGLRVRWPFPPGSKPALSRDSGKHRKDCERGQPEKCEQGEPGSALYMAAWAFGHAPFILAAAIAAFSKGFVAHGLERKIRKLHFISCKTKYVDNEQK
jgi:hypothetical protein